MMNRSIDNVGAFVKESVFAAEAIVDNICEKGAYYVYDKYLRTKDKPFGILSTVFTIGEMLQVIITNYNSI